MSNNGEVVLPSKMVGRQQATKHSAQNLNNSHQCMPLKAVKSKIKPNTAEKRMEDEEGVQDDSIREIHKMFNKMVKLQKLDQIESDMKEIKHSLEFVHAKIDELKKENETWIRNEAERIKLQGE